MQVTEVKDSFSLDSVVPFFQPIMDLANNAVWSYECLARLVTIDEHTYLPSEFLFLVERQQSVSQLTQTVFNRSASYFRDINMAWNINVSLADMKDPEIHAFLYSQLRDYPNPSRISLEITAPNALTEPEVFEDFATVCQALGVCIVIDHFEHNSADLQAILNLPVSAIKISGKLFENAHQNGEQLAQIESLIQQAEMKNIALIAEHIEQKGTLDTVAKLGIKYAQGFYFSQPKAKAD